MATPEERKRATEIITSDYIDTPYPYCLLPRRTQDARKSVERVRLAPRVRTLLKVSTWDGRNVLQVKAD